MSEEEIMQGINKTISFMKEELKADHSCFTIQELWAVNGLLDLYNKEKEKNNNILGLVFECGQIDGEHHKTWVIDQIVRILTENDYDKWVQHYEYDEATGEEYTWDIGIAP